MVSCREQSPPFCLPLLPCHRFVERESCQDWAEEVELFDKVIIEEAIEDGIGAGRGDSNHVADQEGQHHALCNINILDMFSDGSWTIFQSGKVALLRPVLNLFFSVPKNLPVVSKISTASVIIQNRLKGSQL